MRCLEAPHDVFCGVNDSKQNTNCDPVGANGFKSCEPPRLRLRPRVITRHGEEIGMSPHRTRFPGGFPWRICRIFAGLAVLRTPWGLRGNKSHLSNIPFATLKPYSRHRFNTYDRRHQALSPLTDPSTRSRSGIDLQPSIVGDMIRQYPQILEARPKRLKAVVKYLWKVQYE